MSVSTAREATRLTQFVAARLGTANAMLGLIAGAYLMIALDSTVVNVALPAIQADLRFSTTGLAWVFNAYLLTFGGLLLLGGRLGDILGRRRMFVTGVAIFTVSSLLAGLAQSAAWLIAARALQGVGGALATPNTMALLATNFREGRERNRALSVYSAVAISGASVGLVVGGILTTYASWRWSMFINVPIGLAIAWLAPQLIADTARRPGRADVAGALTSTLGMGAIVFGLIRAAANGWDGRTFASLGLGAAMLVAFVVVELRAAQPIVPLHLLRSRRRAGAYLNVLLLPGALFGTFFFMTQFLQEIRGFGPLEAGLAFLPQTFAAVAAVRVAPRIVARFGAPPLMLAGGVLAVAGVALLTTTQPASAYAPWILVPLVLVGAGYGWSFMPLNVTILEGVPAHEAGAASAVTQSMQWVGGSLGLAVLDTVFGSASRAAAATLRPGDLAAPAVIFTRGMSSALDVAVGLVIATMVVVVTVIGTRARSRVAESAPSAAS